MANYPNFDILITSQAACSLRIVNCDTGAIWDFTNGVFVTTFAQATCAKAMVASTLWPGYNLEIPATLPCGQMMALINYAAPATIDEETLPDTGKKFFCAGGGVLRPSVTDVA